MLALPLLVALASATSPGTIALAPASVSLRGQPGDATTQALTLTNATSMDLSFELEAKDVVVRGGARAFADAGQNPGSIAARAIFSPARVVVPAGQARTVRVTVTLPPATSQRAMIALFRGTSRFGQGAASATASLGTLLAFTLSDTISVAASALEVTPQSDAENAAFVQELVNDGDEPVVPKGVAAVLDGDGRLVGRAEFEQRRLLPGERVAVRAEYGGELPPGRYRTLATFAFEGRSFTRAAELLVR